VEAVEDFACLNVITEFNNFCAQPSLERPIRFILGGMQKNRKKALHELEEKESHCLFDGKMDKVL
jgi:hypothetical protein